MSKLREKFDAIIPLYIACEDSDVDKLEQITEDFAIKFFNWTLSENGIDYAMKIETTEELVQIFKENYYD